jgi:hypothetical protein
MGTKYTSRSISGYNDTPPPDDGTAIASNVVKWATHKTKLGDPLKNLAEAINTALVDHFDIGPDRKTANYTTTPSDYNRVIEFDGASLVATLYNEATAGAGYIVTIKNSNSSSLTVNVQGGGLIDGLGSVSLGSGAAKTFIVNSSASEYLQIYGGDSSIPGGGATKMVFVNSSAPDGWTFDASLNDRVLRATSTEANGGSVGGAWAISGLTHSHTHGMNFSTTGYGGSTFVGGDSPTGNYAAASHTHTVSGNTNSISTSAVSSNGSWRPSYIDVIICSKD